MLLSRPSLDGGPVRSPAPAPLTALEEPVGAERRALSVELLWDLVFVLAVTQVITLLDHDATWLGMVKATIALALVWWAWNAYVWASNVHGPESRTLQPTLLLASILIFVCGLALPEAFGREGLLFAITYCAVRVLHVVLYRDAVRHGAASRAAISGFSVTTLLGAALLLVGERRDPEASTESSMPSEPSTAATPAELGCL